MGTAAGPQILEVGPREAWDILSKETAATLVDVRTRPEWDFVGGADLSDLNKDVARIEWKSWPDMDHNPAFVAALKEGLTGLPSHLLFICRSGARSMQAAQAVADALGDEGGAVTCINVAEGFEGDLDPLGRRGGLNGWKARGLAWRQS
ncbi:rhodanese-like domain-containing protein [uncultured Jannaschia sp.]|uniref:rhodanese-like domain-containing protein n=1 Tax=uncultured Jannaschia sp. TaxID=293347 RepID=UPI00262C8E59|nr:rhodanese-like domain-containing protein [uncultured Jannaschia sp.]